MNSLHVAVALFGMTIVPSFLGHLGRGCLRATYCVLMMQAQEEEPEEMIS